MNLLFNLFLEDLQSRHDRTRFPYYNHKTPEPGAQTVSQDENTPADAPKIHVDSDWKEEAQAEKERLAQKEQERAENSEPKPGELPPANFKSLMGVLASQALMGLGMYGDKETGKAIVDLPGSKFAIDLLGVLQEKCKGNLEEDESKELDQVLTELRSRFVQIAQAVATQGTEDAPAPDPTIHPGG